MRKHFLLFNHTSAPKLVKEVRDELGEILADTGEFEAYMGNTTGLPQRDANIVPVNLQEGI